MAHPRSAAEPWQIQGWYAGSLVSRLTSSILFRIFTEDKPKPEETL